MLVPHFGDLCAIQLVRFRLHRGFLEHVRSFSPMNDRETF
jgi:hypothetical protein